MVCEVSEGGMNHYTQLDASGKPVITVTAASTAGARLLIGAETGMWDCERVIVVGTYTHQRGACPITGERLPVDGGQELGGTAVSRIGAALVARARLRNPSATRWTGYIGPNRVDVRTWAGGLLAEVVRCVRIPLPFGAHWSPLSWKDFFLFTVRTPDGRVWRGRCGGEGLVCRFRLVPPKVRRVDAADGLSTSWHVACDTGEVVLTERYGVGGRTLVLTTPSGAPVPLPATVSRAHALAMARAHAQNPAAPIVP
jgi:hypothetical protein